MKKNITKEQIGMATKEELNESKRKCWSTACKKTAIIRDCTGWKYCFKHWIEDYKYGREHGLWNALKQSYINWEAIKLKLKSLY